MIDIDPGDFSPEALAKLAPACADCGKAEAVQIVPAREIYPARSDLWQDREGRDRWHWLCRPCGAYCGVHMGTLKALGSPAGPATRRARQAAHAAFDPLWQKRARISGLKPGKARGLGYAWLAAQLGVQAADCHIAMMDEATALRAAQICKGKLEGAGPGPGKQDDQ